MKDVSGNFLSLINEHQGILHKVCRIYAEPGEYQDLLQDMLVNLWRGYENFRGESKITTWMYRIALYTALSHRRYQSYRKFSPLEGDFSGYDDNQDNQRDAHDIIMTALRYLEPGDRALMMLYLEEYSYKEIGDILGIQVTNVGARLTRNRQKLKGIIEKLEHGRIN